MGGQFPDARIFAERIALVARFPVKVIRAKWRRKIGDAAAKEDWRKGPEFLGNAIEPQRTLTPSASRPAMIASTPAMR